MNFRNTKTQKSNISLNSFALFLQDSHIDDNLQELYYDEWKYHLRMFTCRLMDPIDISEDL